MNTGHIIYLITGVVLGIWVSKVVGSKKNQREVKADRKKEIIELFDSKGKITNDNVQELFRISDATATNYLQELEDEGKIKQIGETGKHVYYILK
jgi:predicted HTH transcriptional regulator